MCGTIAFIGRDRRAVEHCLVGLDAQQERGYHNMGIAIRYADGIGVYKVGQYSDEEGRSIIASADRLRKEIDRDDLSCVAMAQNRWATHGSVALPNAHPISDHQHKLLGVHNGIAENHMYLRENMEALYGLDYKIEYSSETDTEVMINMIALEYDGSNLEEAVERAMSRIDGKNAIIVMASDQPDVLVAYTTGSPLLVCQTENGVMISSMVEGFKSQLSTEEPKYVVVGDGELVVATYDSYRITKGSQVVEKQELDIPLEEFSTGKQGYPTFTEKEIKEQPNVLLNLTRLGLYSDSLDGLDDDSVREKLAQAQNFHFIGSGTSLNACRYAELLFSSFGLRARAWVASEFLHSYPIIDDSDVFFFVSQSGATEDVVSVLREIKKNRDNLLIGIVNKQATQIAREATATVNIRAGKEDGVASTKTFTGTMFRMIQIAVYLARQREMTVFQSGEILKALEALPFQVDKLIRDSEEQIIEMAGRYSEYKQFFFSGKAFSHVIAVEAALKLSELVNESAISSYTLGELKHGILAAIGAGVCSFLIVPDDHLFKYGDAAISQIVSNCGGRVIVVTNREADDFSAPVDDIIHIPKTIAILQPILAAVVSQLFVYHLASKLEKNTDNPDKICKIASTL